MVRHGKDKKRRSGSRGRVKLKNKSWNRWDPNPKIGSKLVKERWDASKSAAINLAAMGLIAKPNHHEQDVDLSQAQPGKASVVALFDVPESDAPSRRTIFPLDAAEEKLMVSCMAKHGDNYKAMFWDTKGVNEMQHTEGKLRKLGARYLLLTPAQRRLPIPGKVEGLCIAAS